MKSQPTNLFRSTIFWTNTLPRVYFTMFRTSFFSLWLDVYRHGRSSDFQREMSQGEAAKMERDRMGMMLENMPVRSDLDALSDLHERRLRVVEAEQRQYTADCCSRIKVVEH